MSEITKDNIQKFIENTLSDSERKETADYINSYNKKNMKESNTFNADKAWDTFAKKISKTETKTQKKDLFYLSRPLKYAASFALIVGMSIFAYYFLKTDKSIDLASNNQIIEHTLPDGSVITLNKNSSISYNNQFKGDTRLVEFSGEAYFDIAKDPNKPFVIQANGSEIEVLGTEFNLFCKNGFTEVTVTEGKVSMTDMSDNESVILNIGEKGEIINGTVRSQLNNDPNFLSWKTKKLYFEQGELLKDVFIDLEKTYDVQIEVDDVSLTLKEINKHHFDENDSLKFILDLFAKAYNFTYSKEQNKIFLILQSD